jgi:hypothetical protein
VGARVGVKTSLGAKVGIEAAGKVGAKVGIPAGSVRAKVGMATGKVGVGVGLATARVGGALVAGLTANEIGADEVAVGQESAAAVETAPGRRSKTRTEVTAKLVEARFFVYW